MGHGSIELTIWEVVCGANRCASGASDVTVAVIVGLGWAGDADGGAIRWGM